MRILTYSKTLTDGFSIYSLIAVICDQGAFVAFTTTDHGFAENTLTTSVSLMSQLRMPVNYGFQVTRNLKSIAVNDSKSGKRDLNFMTKTYQASLNYVCIIIITLSCSPLKAQEIKFETRVELVKNILNELDTSAANCLKQLEDSRSDNQSQCVDFMTDIDGQTTADLISHCDVLKTWRNQYVEDPTSSNETTVTNLKRMKDIEFFCGENFLQKRANNVVDAFELLTEKLSQDFSSLSTNRRFSELQFIHTLDRERTLLKESMLRQNQRQKSEATFRRNEIERELIRQQINSPTYPQN